MYGVEAEVTLQARIDELALEIDSEAFLICNGKYKEETEDTDVSEQLVQVAEDLRNISF